MGQFDVCFDAHPQGLQRRCRLSANADHLITASVQLPAIFQPDPTIGTGDQICRHFDALF